MQAMKIVKLLIIAILISSLGCEKNADIDYVYEYNEGGISFEFPGNWQVAENISEGESRHIVVESPGFAFFAVQKLTKENSFDLSEYVTTYVNLMKDEMPFGKLSEGHKSSVIRNIGGHEINGIKNNITITVLKEEVPHEQTIFKIPLKRSDIFLIAQVATADKQFVTEGFDLIFDTFKIRDER
jgi:hypothetical protein